MANTEKLRVNRQERIGETNVNRNGTLMKIVDYINSKNIIVEFQDEYHYRKRTDYNAFKNGKTDNPYDKTVCGVGYRGVGKFSAGGDNRKTYCIWELMIRRCYSDNSNSTKVCYEDCTVCDEWHNFQNFAQWYEDNYYEIDGQRMQIDKDILYKGNKIYSPQTCLIVPNEINALMVKRKNQRGDLPIGVQLGFGKYVARCHVSNGKREHLGRYNSIEDAFNAYKTRKEQYIKEVADKYRAQISQTLYDALYKYEVEITD